MPLSWAARQANQNGPIPTRPHSLPPPVPLDAISMETLDAVAKSCPPSAAKITLEKGLPTKNHFSFLFLSCPGSFPLSCTRLTRIKPVSIWKLRPFFSFAPDDQQQGRQMGLMEALEMETGKPRCTGSFPSLPRTTPSAPPHSSLRQVTGPTALSPQRRRW